MEFVFAYIAMGIIAITVSIKLFVLGHKKKKIRGQIHELANNNLELTPEEFFEMRNTKVGRELYSNNYNFSGVYILHNKSKDLYYVGQGKKVFNRVNSHFTGKGNGDVYADYKYGDTWTIRMLEIKNSGFATLNELERYAIEAYDAYKKGYNRNRGNA